MIAALVLPNYRMQAFWSHVIGRLEKALVRYSLSSRVAQMRKHVHTDEAVFGLVDQNGLLFAQHGYANALICANNAAKKAHSASILASPIFWATMGPCLRLR
jgi:hypothetical protein